MTIGKPTQFGVTASVKRRSGGMAVARGVTVAGIAVFALLSVLTFTDSLRWWAVAGSVLGAGAYFSLPRLGSLYLRLKLPFWLPPSAPPLVIGDAGLWMLAVWASYVMADHGGDPALSGIRLVETAIILAGLHLLSGVVTGIYRGRWRVGSFGELWGVVAACAATFGLFELVIRITDIPTLDTTGRVLTAGFAVGAMELVRSMWRVTRTRDLRPEAAERILLYGAGRGAAAILPALLEPDSPLRPVAIIDDDSSKRYRTLAGIRVAGTGPRLAEVAEKYGATTVLIAIPSAESATVRSLVSRVDEAGLRPLILPKPAELIAAGAGLSEIREVSEADLLGRRIVDTDLESIAGYLTGRRVLITGAGGSIGSELARQVFRQLPAALVLLDRDESALHGTILSMTGQASMAEDHAVLCDIRDQDALKRIFETRRPEVVFHAAALKHVPMLERFPDEAYKTNVVGTANVLAAARQVGTERFINISTDKAADPINVLGYTKRVAERLTAAMGDETGLPYVSVRFGNVLGSRGSMLITFRSQIEQGGPITVTHPEATRYFMMIEEAVALTIQAGAIGTSGEVLVLDMGQPIRIADVAQMMVRRSGKEIAVVYTGLRPGEKIHEVLFAEGEQDRRPLHPSIAHARVPPLKDIGLTSSPATIESLEQMALRRAEHEGGLRQMAGGTRMPEAPATSGPHG